MAYVASRDLAMVALAAEHHGVVTRATLTDDLGFGATMISGRVASGELRPIRRDVYVVTSMATAHSVVAALVLGVEGSVASHRSAAVLHGMRLAAQRPTVTVAQGRRVVVGGCRVAQTRFLPALDRQTVEGIEVTTAARTLWDLAAELRPAHLRQLVQEQTLAGRPSMPALIACHQALARRGRTGTVAMRAVLADLTDDQPYPASKLEALLSAKLAERGVSGLRRQFAPPWYDGLEGIVDFADPAGRTIIEADGRAWHTLDRHAARDRNRNRMAMRNGWVVVRVGWAELTERTEATLDDIIDIVEQRRTPQSGRSGVTRAS